MKSVHGDQCDLPGMVGEQVLQQPFEDRGFSGTWRPGDSEKAPSAPPEQRFGPGEELLLA
ncbi:hypothetical protein [Arthrobacter humicola]|uniref:hypothetical protein n=1 Tax=Arthrobacter humicola TaxID=409291 RepID=UPI0031E4893F